MPIDTTINFGKVTVSTGYSAAATSIVLSSGHGAKLPSVYPYNLVWWNSTDYGDPADDPNVEIIKVTNKSTDTLTVTRAQEGTSATDKNTANKTYKMILSITKKMVDDIEAHGSSHINIFAWDYSSIVQGTFSFAAFSSHWAAEIFYNASTQAINDEIQYVCYVSSGTWDFILMHVKHTAYGICDVYFDGSLIGQIDMYDAATQRNISSKISGISVTKAGLKTIRLKMASKNASATAYRIGITKLVLIRTA